jgi:hypothetical protein
LQGNIERALKYYRLSLRLYPTPSAKSAIEKLEKPSQDNVNNSSTPPSPRQQQEDNQNNNRNSESEYTTEQVVLVQKIIKCKNYYEILGITQTASESDIKKAYKKLALQMHPDKNRAPSADEAFKKIGQAFACLSNPEKRRSYDVRGSDEPAPVYTRSRHTQYAHHADFEDLTPEEIFAMFFGGAIPTRGSFNNHLIP